MLKLTCQNCQKYPNLNFEWPSPRKFKKKYCTEPSFMWLYKTQYLFERRDIRFSIIHGLQNSLRLWNLMVKLQYFSRLKKHFKKTCFTVHSFKTMDSESIFKTLWQRNSSHIEISQPCSPYWNTWICNTICFCIIEMILHIIRTKHRVS